MEEKIQHIERFRAPDGVIETRLSNLGWIIEKLQHLSVTEADLEEEFEVYEKSPKQKRKQTPKVSPPKATPTPTSTQKDIFIQENNRSP